MIITPEYVRTNYTGSSDTTDAVLEQCLRAALSEVQAIIGSPLQEAEFVWQFLGDRLWYVVYPFVLKVDAASIVVEYRSSLTTSWGVVDNILYERPKLMCTDGFLRGGMYRVTAMLGLLDTVDGELLSADFTESFSYEPLRDVICEWAAAKFYASAGTNAGIKRAGLKQVSEATQGMVTKSQVFVDDAVQRKDWIRRLKPYTRLPLL